MTFEPFPKIARLNRACVITEKIDGTNAQVWVRTVDDFTETAEALTDYHAVVPKSEVVIMAGSRSRWLQPSKTADNYGFAAWVWENARELAKLGPGRHFGEWWGSGIQRGYGLGEKRFSLFNTHRWSNPEERPACCDVVPVLYEGPFSTSIVNDTVTALAMNGSVASPGFKRPEGVVVFHAAQNSLFKVTCEKDEAPKGRVEEAA